MTLVDIIFHYGGDWIRKPHLLYSKKLVHSWGGYDSDLISFIDLVNEYTGELMYIGVQQLIVNGPFGNYYEVVDDSGIRQLLSLISVEFKCLNFYAVDECELSVNVPNIVHYFDSHPPLTEVGTDCSEVECESDNDSEGEGDEVGYDSEELQIIACQKNREIDVGLLNYKELYKGMSFKDIPEARKCINLYSLANKKDLKQKKSDKERLRYKCAPGCPFVVLISGDGDLPGVRIKTINPKHECDEAFDNSRVDYHTIALYFKKKLQDNPMYKIKEMRADIKNVFNTNVSYGKCKRAKREILEILEGSFTDGYNKLEAYATELRESNPGSDVIINLSKDALAQGVRRFLRMYICFHALKMGFKEGLRPFIGLDGTYLKGKSKGQLLIAVGLDCNNQTYPLAWAIVDKETKRTWNWFLELLQRSLDLKEGEGITFMSDMQKGLTQAVHTVLPESNHRYCVKHIEANWCKKWRTDEFKKLLWWCSWCSYEEDFKDQLKSIGKLDKQAAEALLKYPPQAWCRAYFDTVCKNQRVDNNFTESVNAWILEARRKPIINMLEDIRIKLMNQLREREESARLWATSFSPHSMKLYNEYLKIANRCFVNSNGEFGYEVKEDGDTHTVNMAIKRCTCRGWDLTGIPCPHTIKAIQYKKMDPLEEINWWYSKEAYMLTYKHKLHPVRGEKFWKIEESQAMKPPELVKLAGRPKIKRTREKDEAIKRQGEWGVRERKEI